MAAFDKKAEKYNQHQRQPEPPKPPVNTTPVPPAAPTPEPPAPASVVATNEPAISVVTNKAMEEVATAMKAEGAEKDKDDPAITRHPTKDYDLGDNMNRLGGKRLFQSDLLCRHLNEEFYIMEQEFPWGKNPLGGAPIVVTYTREFRITKVLFDNFDGKPSDAILELKKQMAHDHGFRYIYQYPGKVMTPDELTKQLKAEKEWMDSLKK